LEEPVSPQEQQTVAKIQADHWPIKVKIPGRWRKQRRCVLDGQAWMCNRAQLAVDIRAGRRDQAGVMR
jgi:hypothetical protein